MNLLSYIIFDNEVPVMVFVILILIVVGFWRRG